MVAVAVNCDKGGSWSRQRDPPPKKIPNGRYDIRKGRGRDSRGGGWSSVAGVTKSGLSSWVG